MSAIAGRVLLIPKGNYDSTATYTMLDMVVYNGSSYICKQECTGVVPTNTTYWMLNASGSAVAYINDIGDVVITNVSNGQVLMYDSTTQKWVNGTLTLNGLNDTQFASLSDGQVLKYNATTQKWENADEAGGILPHLIVISETGSTVTATKGQTVITATETSTGHFECDLTELGTWTIDAILGGEDAQVSLVVDTVKVYTVDDSHFHATVTVKYPTGATCRLQSTDETLYATGSPYTFTVHHAETYTITVTYNQRIYTDTVTFTTEGQSFSKTLPSPSEVDANDINLWLWFGDVSGSYSSLSDILADSTALSTLMASTDAVDYLVRCKEWINAGLVPQMTSNTTPSGECSASSIETSSYPAWKAFDGDNTSSWNSAGTSSGANAYIQYTFSSAIKVVRVRIRPVYGVSSQALFLKSFEIQASNDNFVSDIHTLYTGSFSNENTDVFINLNNSNSYLSYRLVCKDSYRVENNLKYYAIRTLQFYALEQGIPENQSAMSYIGLNNYCANTLLADEDWLDGIVNSTYIESVLNVKVPTMTSNTAPSGEAFSSVAGSASYGYAWNAFDKTSTGWTGQNSQGTATPPQSVGYKFTSDVCVKGAMIKPMWLSTHIKMKNYKIQASTNNSTWVDLYTGIIATDSQSENIEHYIPISNNNYYRYYRCNCLDSWSGAVGITEMQFYGREDV